MFDTHVDIAVKHMNSSLRKLLKEGTTDNNSIGKTFPQLSVYSPADISCNVSKTGILTCP